MHLLELSLSGAVMIFVIWLLRSILQHRVRREVWLALWAIVVLRLLVPVTVSSPLSVYNLPVFSATQPAVVEVTQAPPAAESTAVPVPAQVDAAPKLDPAVILTGVWLCGTAAVLGMGIVCHIRSRRRYRFSLPMETREKLPRNTCLRGMEGLDAPLTYGVFRPVILIPWELQADCEEYRHILQHEISHVRHFDVLYKGFLLLTAAVHWFNPLVWVMLYTASQDMEMRCDADAVRALGSGTKIDYARTLVQAEERRLLGYLQIGFSYSSTAQRIKALSKGRTNPAASLIAGIVLAALLIGVFATAGVAAEPPAMPQEETVEAESVSAPEADPAPIIEPEPIPEPEPVPVPEETEPEQEEEVEPQEEVEAESEPAPEPTPDPEPTPEPTADAPQDVEIELPPEENPNKAPIPEPEPEPAPAGAIYPPGSLSFIQGESRTVPVGTMWTELYSDNPAVLQVGGVVGGGSYVSTFTARREGSANVYYNLNGSWQFFAAVTVQP